MTQKKLHIAGLIFFTAIFACLLPLFFHQAGDSPENPEPPARASNFPKSRAVPSPASDALPAVPAMVAENSEIPESIGETPQYDHPHIEGNCAHCLAEEKLVVYRKDFARLQFDQLSQSHQLDQASTVALLEACEKFSNSILKRWSFTDSRPIPPPPAVIHEAERRYLLPILESLPKTVE